MKAFNFGTKEEADKEQQILNARHAFSMQYMKEKGWGEDFTQLSIQQIMEIRSQEGWKNPV